MLFTDTEVTVKSPSLFGKIMTYDQVGIDRKGVSIMTVVKKTKVVNSYGYYIFKIDRCRHTE
jgi:hypothetical protein